jgi:glutamate formiminotransferase/formiminotetrahydrofolate cyclodeaminase
VPTASLFYAQKMDKMEPLIECVPNFSEGNNENSIREIVEAIGSVRGAKVLHVDAGKAANRTVVTFAGLPEAVVEAAFRGIKAAAACIDMRLQKGTHPRIGATDVCPLVPVRGISMEEVVSHSMVLGERVGEALGIPVYMYEASASVSERTKLENIRSGEYEGFSKKMSEAQWVPDFGPRNFNPISGATVIGARKFLIAYNINLETSSVPSAKAIAAQIRESGFLKKDEKGQPVRMPGLFKAVKAIGWYIDEYQKAQVSVNITDFERTSVHEVYEAVCKLASEQQIAVSGSELIGLIPLKAILKAGNYYAQLKGDRAPFSEEVLVDLAVQHMGLNALRPFDSRKKIIEYLL